VDDDSDRGTFNQIIKPQLDELLEEVGLVSKKEDIPKQSEPRFRPVDNLVLGELSNDVADALDSAKGLQRAYLEAKKEYLAEVKDKNDLSSDEINNIKEEHELNPDREGSLAYKYKDFTKRLFDKAKTTEDLQAFLTIAPVELKSLRKRALSEIKEIKTDRLFNEFDLYESINADEDLEVVWGEIQKRGLYLSVEGPCYVKEGEGWTQFESFKGHLDQGESEKSFPSISDDQLFDQIRSDFNKIKQEKIGNQPDGGISSPSEKDSAESKVGEGETEQEPKQQPDQESEQKNMSEMLTGERIKDLLESGRESGKSKQEIYKEIWEQAKNRGAIETLDGGKYVRKDTDVGISGHTWYRISPNGSRGQYGYPETRASLEEDGDVPYAYNEFFKGEVKKYDSQLKNDNRANQSTDIAGEVPEAVKEVKEITDSASDKIPQSIKNRVPMNDPLKMSYAEDLSSDVKDKLKDGQGLYRAYIHEYRKYQAQKQTEGKDVSHALRKKFRLGDQDSLAYKLKDFSQKIIRKAQTSADIQAFLDIAPDDMFGELKDHARKALEDANYREALVKSQNQIEDLQKMRREVREVADDYGDEDKLRTIDDVIHGLKTNPQEYVDKAGGLIEKLGTPVREGTQTQKDKELLEGADIPSLSVGDGVMLTEKGSPRWSEHHAVKDIIYKEDGEPLINTDKDSAYRPISKFEAKDVEEANQEKGREGDSSEGSEAKKTNELREQSKMLTRKEIRDMIHNANSVDEAASGILSHERIFWNENHFAQKDGDNWVVHSSDEQNKQRDISPEEMREHINDAAVELNERTKLKIDNFVDGVAKSVNKIIEALPQEESTKDEEEFKSDFQKLRNELVAQNSLLPKQTIKDYRDRFVQLMHYYKNERQDIWRSSNIVYRPDVKECVKEIDELLEKSV
jgi:hypothetical protein